MLPIRRLLEVTSTSSFSKALETIPGAGFEFPAVCLFCFFQFIAFSDKGFPCSFVVLECCQRWFHSSSWTIFRTCFGNSAATDQCDTQANNTNDAKFKIHLQSSSKNLKIHYGLMVISDFSIVWRWPCHTNLTVQFYLNSHGLSISPWPFQAKRNKRRYYFHPR